MTMSRECWLLHLLLVWCSLEHTCLLTCVNAQGVTIRKVIPAEGDPVEGNEVQLGCEATGLMAGYIIEWTRIVDAQEVAVARNGMSVDPRYKIYTSAASGTQNRLQFVLFIADKEDTAVSYGCRVRDSVELNSTILVDAQTISFTVLYFPSAMYPSCIPDGPFTVQEGTTVNMSCTTELGNPAVQTQILTTSTVYAWTYGRDSKEQMRSLQLSVTAADDEGSYECQITPHSNPSPFTGMERSCTIGPITVGPMTTPQHPLSSVEPTSLDSHRTMTGETSLKPTTDQSNFNMSYCQLCQAVPTTTKESNVVYTPWLVCFIISLILFIVSLIVNIFLIKHRYLNITKEKETNVPKADPYMELQPTEDKNRVYMEPTTATTTTQDTYYQPVEVEIDSPEYDYARPEGSTNTNTSYEAVRQPQSSSERPYQNIKS